MAHERILRVLIAAVAARGVLAEPMNMARAETDHAAYGGEWVRNDSLAPPFDRRLFSVVPGFHEGHMQRDREAAGVARTFSPLGEPGRSAPRMTGDFSCHRQVRERRGLAVRVAGGERVAAHGAPRRGSTVRGARRRARSDDRRFAVARPRRRLAGKVKGNKRASSPESNAGTRSSRLGARGGSRPNLACRRTLRARPALSRRFVPSEVSKQFRSQVPKVLQGESPKAAHERVGPRVLRRRRGVNRRRPVAGKGVEVFDGAVARATRCDGGSAFEFAEPQRPWSLARSAGVPFMPGAASHPPRGRRRGSSRRPIRASRFARRASERSPRSPPASGEPVFLLDPPPPIPNPSQAYEVWRLDANRLYQIVVGLRSGDAGARRAVIYNCFAHLDEVMRALARCYAAAAAPPLAPAAALALARRDVLVWRAPAARPFSTGRARDGRAPLGGAPRSPPWPPRSGASRTAPRPTSASTSAFSIGPRRRARSAGSATARTRRATRRTRPGSDPVPLPPGVPPLSLFFGRPSRSLLPTRRAR